MRQHKPVRSQKGKTPTLASLIQARLIEEIVQARIGPGTRLEEVELAKRYNVSRTPVREALRQLSALGMLNVTPRRGAIVVDLAAGNRLRETLEVISDLEASAARYAAQRMSAPQRQSLLALHQEIGELVAREDAHAFDSGNVRLHRMIHEGSGNVLLQESIAQMRIRILPYTRAEMMSERSRITVSHAEHRGFVQAIVRGEAELAYHAMRFHVIRAGELPEDLAQSTPSLSPT